jgi:tetratricopeptide (TPR) repeat protein
VLPSSNLSSREQRELLREHFEQAWQAGTPPSIEDYLTSSVQDRTTLLRELVQTDLEYRLRAGEAVRAEEYLGRFPELASDAEALLGLIAAEYRHRQHLGQQPALAEYLERFPEYREQLLHTTVADTQVTQHHCPAEGGTDALLPALDMRYRVDSFLAKGGMGAVYRILDTDFQRPLAVKVLQASLRGQVHREERFLREARLTGQLQHPGIPPVQEMGRLSDGRPYFIMKLVQGRDLRALLRERDSPLTKQTYYLGVFEQICRTVAYAHAQSILHRDLKPSNIMVGAFGEVQVMDWGLAKALVAAGPVAATAAGQTCSTVEHIKTPQLPDAESVAGEVIGTPAYMAPEQARGEVEQLDRTCDVFGLGGILCELLTGQPPFATGDKLHDQRRAMKGDLSEAFARLDGCGADAELIALAKRCLAPERGDRASDAGVVAQAVAAYLEMVRERLRQAEVARGQALVRVQEERKRRRLTLVLAGVVLLVLLGGIVGTTMALVRAWEQTERAETAEGEAKEQATLAQTRRGEAERERGHALEAKNEATAKATLAAAEAQRAEEQAEIARKVKDYLVRAFRNPDPYVPGEKVTVARVLRQAEQEIDQLDQPLLQEELLAVIGKTYVNLKLPEAIRVYEKVVKFRTKRLGPDHPDTLFGIHNLAVAYQADGQLKKALPLYEETLEKQKAQLGPDHPDQHGEPGPRVRGRRPAAESAAAVRRGPGKDKGKVGPRPPPHL